MPNRAIVQAKRLLEIRSGPGSITLPSQYTELHLTFGKRLNGGHMGPRKFAQVNLPRIQYHNPGLSIHVTRVFEVEDPKNTRVKAIMKLVKSGELAEDAQEIDVRNLHSDEILKKLVELTGATETATAAATLDQSTVAEIQTAAAHA